MKNIFYILLFFIFSMGAINAQSSSIYGKITDEERSEEMLYVNIYFYKNGIYTTECKTDSNGNFFIPIDPGKYEVKVNYLGYPDRIITNTIINRGQRTKLDIQLISDCSHSITTDYKIPLIKTDNSSTSITIISEEIHKEPHKDIPQLIQSMPGVSINNF